MNNLSSYCSLVDAKIRAFDKDLPVPSLNYFLLFKIQWEDQTDGADDGNDRIRHFFCSSRRHTFKSELSSWCCFRHLVYSLRFIWRIFTFQFSRNKRKLLFFTEGGSLLGALLKQELDRNRGLLFWGSGQDRAGGVRACRRDWNQILFIAERYHKKNKCKLYNYSTPQRNNKNLLKNETLP